jgi:hypothetical protein
VQSVITAAQTTLIQLNQILDLTPVKSLTAADGILEDMELLCDLIKQTEAINTDLQSLEAQMAALLDVQQAPRTRPDLQRRMDELKQMRQQARVYAMRTQTLIKTLLRTGDHMKALLTDVTKLVGNLSGQQRLAELQTTIHKTLAVQAAQAAAWQRMDTLDKMSDVLVVESITLIERSRMDGWPRW